MIPSIPKTDSSTPTPVNMIISEENIEPLLHEFLKIPYVSDTLPKISELCDNAYTEAKNNALIFQGKITYQLKNLKLDPDCTVTINLNYDNSTVQTTNSTIFKGMQFPALLPYFKDEYKNLLSSIPNLTPITITQVMDFTNNSITESIETPQKGKLDLIKSSLTTTPLSPDEIQIRMRAIEQYCLRLPELGFQVTKK